MRLGSLSLSLGANRGSGGTPAIPTAPGAVSNLAATRGDQQAALTWSAPSSGGSPITDYVVEYKLTSEPTTWSTFADGTSASTGATVTGLTNGSAYDFRVKAVNLIGTGDASNVASATPAAVPSAIVLTATAGDTQAVLSHSAPAANGSAITDYVYEYKLDSEPTTWTTWSDGTSTTPGATITGLTNGAVYDFRAFAVNGVGTSAASNIETKIPAAASGVVEIVRNDALSRFDISNTASFPSGTWTWYDDDGVQVGTVTTPYLLKSAVPAGELAKGRANGNAATDSLLWGVTQDNVVLNWDGTGVADGTDFNGYGGWVGPAGKLLFQGGKLKLQSALSYPNWWWTRTMATPDYDFEMTLDFDSGSGAPSDNSRIREMYVNWIDESNWVMLRVIGSTAQVEKRVAGSYTSLTGSITSGNVNGDKFVFSSRVIGGVLYVQVTKNGTRVDGGGVDGLVVTGLTPTAKLSTTFGFNTDTSNPSYPYSVASAMKITSLPDSGILVSNILFPDPAGGTPRINFVGYTDYTGMEAVVMSAEGQQLGSIIPFTGLTPGAYDLEFDQPTETQGQSGAFLRVRETANPTNHTDHPMPIIPFFPALFSKGMNNSGGGVDHRNLFSSFEVRFPDHSFRYLRQAGATIDPATEVAATDVGMGYDGVIQSYVAGWGAYHDYFCYKTVEPGTYEVDLGNTALTGVWTDGAGSAPVDATVVSPFVAGVGVINITSATPNLRLRVSGGTSGSLNLDPTGYFQSDTNRSRLYADSSIIPFTALPATVERHLDTTAGNGDGVIRMTADQIWAGASGVAGPFSPEMIAQKANAQGLAAVWIPMSCLWRGEAFIVAYLTRLVAALDPGIVIILEGPNELWNKAFSTVTRWGLENGVNAGFWNTNGDAAPITSIWSGGFVNHDPETLSMTTTYSTNDLVLFDSFYGVGTVLLRAKRATVTGTADYPQRSGSTAIDSDAWEVLAQNSDCERAKMRYGAEWSDYLWGLLDQVCIDAGYNPRTKTVRYYGHQQGAPLADWADWNGIHARIDAHGDAPYHNNDLFSYDYGPFTSGEKALLATDVPGFVDAAYVHATAGVSAKIAEFAPKKASIDAFWAARGYAPNAKKYACYEMGCHAVTSPSPADGSTGHWHANMNSAFPAFRNDARFATLTQTYTQGFKDDAKPWLAMYFNSVGQLAASYEGRFGHWPLMDTNTDTTNPGFLGFAAVANEA